MENSQGPVGKMETQLKLWGARLDQVLAKAEKAGSELSAERRKRVDELKAKYQAAQTRLAEAKAAGSEKWEVLKTGIESAWRELEAAFKKGMETQEFKTVREKLYQSPVSVGSKEFEAHLKEYWAKEEKMFKEIGMIKEPATQPY